MQRLNATVRLEQAVKASAAAQAKAKQNPPTELVQRFGTLAVQQVRRVLTGARQRCTNPRAVGYENYGGRGIRFVFPDIQAGVTWILDNLGPKPSLLHSIDRIDNNRHYEPGNLRWATRTEQARNKRAYKRTKTGERIRQLQQQRPDLTYETLRNWIKQGASDEEIIQRRKYARSSL